MNLLDQARQFAARNASKNPIERFDQHHFAAELGENGGCFQSDVATANYDNALGAAFKLRHFCVATGLIDKYEAGDITAHDLDGREGFVQIKIEPAKGDFAAKNVVKDYGRPEAKAGSEEAAQFADADNAAAAQEDDGLPDV